jgi:hypothetical protein
VYCVPGFPRDRKFIDSLIAKISDSYTPPPRTPLAKISDYISEDAQVVMLRDPWTAQYNMLSRGFKCVGDLRTKMLDAGVPELLLGEYDRESKDDEDEPDKSSSFALQACTMRYLFTVIHPMLQIQWSIDTL